MTLISLQFVLFFAAVYCIYFLAGRVAPEHQWKVLLVANIVFYVLAGSWQALAFIAIVGTTTWYAARVMGKMSDEAKAARKATKDRKERKAIKERTTQKKRRVLLVALVVVLGILGYLKYWNVILFNFGLAKSTTSLGILLPLGISFYTFQSIMYVIDVYNDKYAPEQSLVRYLTFVSYFPQMVQGPINRYNELAPQLFASRSADLTSFRRGLWLLWYGVFKKMVIANVLVGNIGAIFGNVTSTIPGSAALLGVITYSLQEYADFSGGIDIVRGASEMLGIEMSLNFRQPYFSTSLSDFWRRWHMSLGVFMKDYLFYPLALTKPMQNFGKWGQKTLGRHLGRTLPACVANIVVFLVVGLWHGAEWHFLIWGLLNGLVIAGADLLAPVFDRMRAALHINAEALPYRIFCMVRTFLLVCLIRYFDVMPNPVHSFICLKNTFFNFMPMPYKDGLAMLGVAGVELYGLSRLALLGCALVFVVSVLKERGTDVRGLLIAQTGLKGLVIRTAIICVMVALVLAAFPYSLTTDATFAYANF